MSAMNELIDGMAQGREWGVAPQKTSQTNKLSGPARVGWRTCSPARCRALTRSWVVSPVSGPGMGASRERVAGPWSARGDGPRIPAYGGHSRAFPLIPRNPRGSPAGRDVGLVGAHGGGLGDPVAG